MYSTGIHNAKVVLRMQLGGLAYANLTHPPTMVCLQVLIWLLVVGYALRSAEVKLDALTFRGDKAHNGTIGNANGKAHGSFGGVLGLGDWHTSAGGKGGANANGKPNWSSGFGGWRRFLPGA